jgi:hypothetical protein
MVKSSDVLLILVRYGNKESFAQLLLTRAMTWLTLVLTGRHPVPTRSSSLCHWMFV